MAKITVTAPTAPFVQAHVSVGASKPAPVVRAQTFATLVFSGLETVLLDSKKPDLHLTVKLSKGTRLVLLLLDPKGKTVARWSLALRGGSHKLSLLLPLKARHAGHDRLRINQTGDSKPTTLSVFLRA